MIIIYSKIKKLCFISQYRDYKKFCKKILVDTREYVQRIVTSILEPTVHEA